MNKTSSLLFLLTIFTLLLTNCENNEIGIDSNIANKNIKLSYVDINDLKSDPKIFKKLENIIAKQNDFLRKSITDSNLDFIILTDKVKYIEKDEYHSYTFPIIRYDKSDRNIENLVLKSNSVGDYDAVIVSYDFTAEELETFAEEDLNSRDVTYTFIDFDESIVTKSITKSWTICEEKWQLHGFRSPQTWEINYAWVLVSVDCTSGGGGGSTPTDPTGGGSNTDPFGEDETGGGGSSDGSGSGDSPPGFDDIITSPTVSIIVDPLFEIEFPCQSAIVQNSFLRTAPLSGIILDVFNSNNAEYNLVFDVNYSLGDGIAGGTLPTSQESEWNLGELDIMVGFSEALLNNGTDLAIVTTTIHESLHAVFIYLLETGRLTVDNTGGDYDLTRMVSAYLTMRIEEDFAGSGQTSASLVDQHMHDYMTNFVEDIATAVSEYGRANGYNLPFSYYKDLAWLGLVNNLEQILTDDGDYSEEDEAEITRIRTIIENEFQNKPDARGTQCTN